MWQSKGCLFDCNYTRALRLPQELEGGGVGGGGGGGGGFWDLIEDAME